MGNSKAIDSLTETMPRRVRNLLNKLDEFGWLEKMDLSDLPGFHDDDEHDGISGYSSSDSSSDSSTSSDYETDGMSTNYDSYFYDSDDGYDGYSYENSNYDSYDDGNGSDILTDSDTGSEPESDLDYEFGSTSDTDSD